MSTTEKVRKEKGPIRTEAMLPFGLVLGAMIAYFSLFFDAHLRKAIEWGATRGNGAEVNIGSLKSSFTGAEIRIGDIEVTDPAKPRLNRAVLGKVQLKLSWDALLRAKVLIESASLEGIAVDSPRRKPGFVLPPEKESGGTWATELKAQVIEKTRAALSQSKLGDLVKVLDGADPAKQLQGFKANLKTLERITQLETELKTKESQWSQSVASLGGTSQTAGLKAKLEEVKNARPGNPAEAAAQLTKANGLIAELNTQIDTVKTQGDKLTQDIQAFNTSINELDQLSAQDRQSIEGQIKLPSVDARALGQQLFGGMVLDEVASARHYVALGRKHMPSLPAGSDKPVPHPRARGRSYDFGGRSYPLFWLKEARFSSTGEFSALGGDVNGKLTDVASSPAKIGKPAVLELNADFPKRDLRQIHVRAAFDHTRAVAENRLMVKVGGFPVEKQMFSESPDLRFGFDQARGGAELAGTLTGDHVALTLTSRFKDIAFAIDTPSSLLKDALKQVTQRLPIVDLKATVSGTWENLGVAVESNLASALEQGLKGLIQGKLTEARKKIDEMIEAQVGPRKKALTDKYSGTKSQVTGQVDEKRKQLESLKGEAIAKADAFKSQANAVQQKAQDQIKKAIPSGLFGR